MASSCRFEKITSPISFPEKNLEIRSSAPNATAVYDLYGVVNHTGSLTCGHYTAVCKSETDRWFVYNDSEVHPVSNVEEKLAACARTCYVLFYKRQDPRIANVINYGKVD